MTPIFTSFCCACACRGVPIAAAKPPPHHCFENQYSPRTVGRLYPAFASVSNSVLEVSAPWIDKNLPVPLTNLIVPCDVPRRDPVAVGSVELTKTTSRKSLFPSSSIQVS